LSDESGQSGKLSAKGRYDVLVVCDFTELTRILDVYRFFRQPPSIVLVTRGRQITADIGISIRSQSVPLPVITLESGRVLAAFISAMCYLLYSFVCFRNIRRVAFNVTLVHAHYLFPQGLFGLILARLFHVPFIVTAAGQDVNVLMRKSVFFRAICRLLAGQANLTIAVSRPLQRQLCRLGVTNTVYLPNSADTSTIHPTRSSPRPSILFVGSMTERKQPLILVRAFEKIMSEIPEATLTMVGDGPLRSLLLEETKQRGLSANVIFLTRVTDKVLMQLLRRSSIFALPSSSEGLSLALLEAMATGKVIVASANESHCDVLTNGSDALLFQPGNEQELVEQLLSALRDRRLRSRLSRSARQLCLREFSNATIGTRLEEVYLSTIQQNNGN
jgi:glycosyltransferase involved in cell wall biosynthesis